MALKTSSSILFIVIGLMLIGGIFRLYNLNWGAPYYFHPDERNIAHSITGLSLSDMNPKFFAYGSLPIYTVYIAGVFTNLLRGVTDTTVSFETAILLLRSLSFLFSLLIIPLLFILGKMLRNVTTGIIAATLGAFNVGFIQFAHFGTFEMWLTLGSLLLFYLCLEYVKKPATRLTLLIGVVFGILCAVKVSSLALFPIIALTFFLTGKQKNRESYLLVGKKSFLVVSIGAIIYLATNPYVIMDLISFLNSMRYESSVAAGTLSVFYTGEFVHALPVLYPLTQVYPFLLNPVIFLVFLPALVFTAATAFNSKKTSLLLLFGFLAVLFFSQAFLYVQWTRYYVPTIPFMILIIAYAISPYLNLLKSGQQKITTAIVVALLSISSFVFSLAYVITAYIEPDARVEAARWAAQAINRGAPIVSEVYDLGILPFNDRFNAITLYDFYSLDGGVPAEPLAEVLKANEYVILPSQRIIKPRLMNPNTYPAGNVVYKTFLSDYRLLYQTPCSIWCHIAYFGDPVYAYEGTATVFDRPTVYIFQKQ